MATKLTVPESTLAIYRKRVENGTWTQAQMDELVAREENIWSPAAHRDARRINRREASY